MGEKTDKNLAYAFAAESKAAARNETFAKKADKDKYPQLARFFRALSDAESIHARRYLLLMRGKVGSSEENLNTAIKTDINKDTDIYGRMFQDAVHEGIRGAEKAFLQSRDVAVRHANLYKIAVEGMLNDRETEYHVCQICGYISEEKTPENCPICGAVNTRFKSIT